MPRRLTAAHNRRLVGKIDMARNLVISFCYAPDWLLWDNATPVSLSLPLREQTHRGATEFG